MTANWNDEFVTVNQIAVHLQLNPQTIRNWIDAGRLPAVRIGRRVRVRRVDLDRLIAEGATHPELNPSKELSDAAELDKTLVALRVAYRQADGMLGRRSAARRGELATELQNLASAVDAVLQQLP